MADLVTTDKVAVKLTAAQRIEQAMVDAIAENSAKVEKIAGQKNISAAEKEKRITALNDPEALRKLMLAGRERVKKELAKEEAEANKDDSSQ